MGHVVEILETNCEENQKEKCRQEESGDWEAIENQRSGGLGSIKKRETDKKEVRSVRRGRNFYKKIEKFQESVELQNTYGSSNKLNSSIVHTQEQIEKVNQVVNTNLREQENLIKTKIFERLHKKNEIIKNRSMLMFTDTTTTNDSTNILHTSMVDGVLERKEYQKKTEFLKILESKKLMKDQRCKSSSLLKQNSPNEKD